MKGHPSTHSRSRAYVGGEWTHQPVVVHTESVATLDTTKRGNQMASKPSESPAEQLRRWLERLGNAILGEPAPVPIPVPVPVNGGRQRRPQRDRE